MLGLIRRRRRTRVWTAAVSIADDPIQLDELAAVLVTALAAIEQPGRTVQSVSLAPVGGRVILATIVYRERVGRTVGRG
jgi:hypothetical protein